MVTKSSMCGKGGAAVGGEVVRGRRSALGRRGCSAACAALAWLPGFCGSREDAVPCAGHVHTVMYRLDAAALRTRAKRRELRCPTIHAVSAPHTVVGVRPHVHHHPKQVVGRVGIRAVIGSVAELELKGEHHAVHQLLQPAGSGSGLGCWLGVGGGGRLGGIG